jgi:hypothetical protein
MVTRLKGENNPAQGVALGLEFGHSPRYSILKG